MSFQQNHQEEVIWNKYSVIVIDAGLYQKTSPSASQLTLILQHLAFEKTFISCSIEFGWQLMICTLFPNFRASSLNNG